MVIWKAALGFLGAWGEQKNACVYDTSQLSIAFLMHAGMIHVSLNIFICGTDVFTLLY